MYGRLTSLMVHLVRVAKLGRKADLFGDKGGCWEVNRGEDYDEDLW